MKKLSKKHKIILCSSIGALILIAIIGVAIVLLNKGEENNKVASKPKPSNNTTEKEEAKVNIIDLESDTRPYAVMINNINEARLVQSGTSKAYIVYEILAEGGITRLMALFKDIEVNKLGSIRSARDYYLDYVLENDAIFVHAGWSPQAQADIPALGINNINGLYDPEFKRLDTGEYGGYPSFLAYEHTLFTDTTKLKAAVERKGYRDTTSQENLLTYSATPIDYTKEKSVSDANKIVLTYSTYTEVTYEYDAAKKVYKRFNRNGQSNVDHGTEEQVTAKNIIAYQVNCYNIPNDPKGRIKVENTGTGTGYYISEGKAIKIKWSKKDRSSQTKYMLEDGTELKVNDGNTFIQILPTTGNIVVS